MIHIERSPIRRYSRVASFGSLACAAAMNWVVLSAPALTHAAVPGTASVRSGEVSIPAAEDDDPLPRSWAGPRALPIGEQGPPTYDGSLSTSDGSLHGYTRMTTPDGTIVYTNRPQDEVRRELSRR
jgi:hypothetical protein